MSKPRVVIVGSGMASVAMVEALLSRDGAAAFDISVLGADRRGACDRRTLAQAIRGHTPDAAAARGAAWLERNGVHSLLGVRARVIDRVRKRVHGDGVVLPYDKLILATGSSAYLPPIVGLLEAGGKLRQGVFLTRSLDDCIALASVSSRCQRVAVIGGGQLGLCALSALSGANREVHLFELSPRLLGDHVDDYGSDLIRSRAEASGATVHLAARAKELTGRDSVTGIRFTDGPSFDCDLVVVTAGGQPCTWLAFQCGLSVERGVVVDGHLRSADDPHVYALGACAQWRARISTIPEEIRQQAEIIASHLRGGREAERYQAELVGREFELLGLQFFAMGHSESQRGDDVFVTSQPSSEKYKKLVWRRGRLVGALLVGDTRRASDIRDLYVARVPVPREKQTTLLDFGAS